MIQVHVINDANRHLYERELDEHHQIRHRIYVEELQCRGLKPRADKREYDQFDMDETVYVLALEEGRVVGGLRLVPTTGPHLIADVFPHFASMQGVPRAPTSRNGHASSWCRSAARNTAAPRFAPPSSPPCSNTPCTRGFPQSRYS